MNRATVLSTPPIYYVTNPGARGKRNDDYADYFQVKASQNEHELIVLLLADGVTSTGSGDQASRIAVETIKKTLGQDNNKQPLPQRLEHAVLQANQEIWHQAQASAEQKNMSTTLVLAAIDGNELRVAHVGDSRAYLVRRGVAHRLTLDHTWVQEALDVGRLTEKSARRHPNRHVIQRYLGISPQVEVDHTLILPGTYSNNPRQRKSVERLTLQAGDVIILCSDGLTESVSDGEIKEIVLHFEEQPQHIANALVELALERNEGDNITVMLMAFPAPEPQAMVSRQIVESDPPSANERASAGGTWFGRAIAVASLCILILVAVILWGDWMGNKAISISSAAPISTTAPPRSGDVATLSIRTGHTPTNSLAVQIVRPGQTRSIAVALGASTVTLTPTPSATKVTRVPTDELPTATATPPPTPIPLPTRASIVIAPALQFRAIHLKPSEDLVIHDRRELGFEIEPLPRDGQRFLVIGWKAKEIGQNQFGCFRADGEVVTPLSNAVALKDSDAEIAVVITNQELRAKGLKENSRYCWGVALDSNPFGLISEPGDDLKLRIESVNEDGNKKDDSPPAIPAPTKVPPEPAEPVPTEVPPRDEEES